MARPARFIGLGSWHGDDCVGLRVAEEMAHRCEGRIDVILAGTPATLLTCIDDVSHLVICDGCHTGAAPGTLLCWHWPSDEFSQARFTGTHDLSLPAVLALAEQLECLPARITIWAVEVEKTLPGSTMSEHLAARLSEIVEEICATLVADEPCGAIGHA